MDYSDLENRIIFLLETGRNLEVGMPLVMAMEAVEHHLKGYAKEIKEMVDYIGEGGDFAGALKKQGYEEEVVSLARLSEKGAILEKGMPRMADYLIEVRKNKIKGEIGVYDWWKDLLEVGIPLVEVLEEIVSYIDSIGNPELREGFKGLKKGAEKGELLCMVMERYPKVFDEEIVREVAMGEMRGGMDKSLGRVVEKLEYKREKVF